MLWARHTSDPSEFPRAMDGQNGLYPTNLAWDNFTGVCWCKAGRGRHKPAVEGGTLGGRLNNGTTSLFHTRIGVHVSVHSLDLATVLILDCYGTSKNQHMTYWIVIRFIFCISNSSFYDD